VSARYKTVKRGGKTVLLHRWLMAEHLGRPLLRTEEVHHKNRDRSDNRLDNLELKTTLEHQAEHHPAVHPVTKACAICAREFTPHKTKRKRQQTCGQAACRSALIAVRRHGVSLDAARARYCPEAAEALVRANAPGLVEERVA
jgi:hypothetical protein